MIKLVISDFDGTFLNSEGDFARDLYQEVKTIMDAQGVVFAPCTGKQCERIESLFDGKTDDLWILGDSATRIKHQGDYVFQSLLPNDIGRKIIQKLEDLAKDQVIIACTPTTAIVKDTTPEKDVEKVRGSYTNLKRVANLQTITEDFVKITVFDPYLRCFETITHLDEFANDAYMVASEAAWLDIANKGVHKGTTVQKLQEILGVSKAETMVFGDGLNDVELMAMGDYSFAVRNAVPETKAVAKYITRSNDENGVLLTIQELLALQG